MQYLHYTDYKPYQFLIMIGLMPSGHSDVSQLLRGPGGQSVFVGADNDLTVHGKRGSIVVPEETVSIARRDVEGNKEREGCSDRQTRKRILNGRFQHGVCAWSIAMMAAHLSV